MRYFLAKCDPSDYGFEDLLRDKSTLWDGVTHPTAVKAIASMRKGDRVLMYHSGGVSAIVGLARVESNATADQANPKLWVVRLAAVCRLEPPTSLAEIKAAGQFGDWALVRQGRLSTMECPGEFVDWLRPRYPKVKL